MVVTIFYTGRSGSWSLDEIEHEATVLEHVTDEIQQADEMKLDEACVLVNGVDFPFDSNEEVEHRTYKVLYLLSP